MKKGQTLKQIGFDQGIIAAAVYLLNDDPHRNRDVAERMLQSYEPDLHQGSVGDLATLRQFNLDYCDRYPKA